MNPHGYSIVHTHVYSACTSCVCVCVHKNYLTSEGNQLDEWSKRGKRENISKSGRRKEKREVLEPFTQVHKSSNDSAPDLPNLLFSY